MTIAFEAKRAYMNTTGLGSYARNHLALTSSLPDVNHIYSLTPGKKISDKRLASPKISVVLPSGLWKVSPPVWRRAYLGREAQKLSADIFHGLSAELPSDIGHFKGKVVVTVHDVLFRSRPGDYSAFDRWMHDYKLKRALSAAHHIVCISRETLDQLHQFYNISPEKSTVIYQPVHPDFYSAEKYHSIIKPPFERYMLCVGTIEPRKNTLSLLKAVEITNIPLVLIGRVKDNYKKTVFPLIQTLKQKKLLYTAQVSDTTELAAWYHHSAFSLYPSLAEGFGLPPLESAAAGRACITGPSPCLVESSGLPECQIDGTPEHLANQILSLWDNEERLNRLNKQAKSHAENFRPEKIRQQWEKFYTSL